jgi:excisionase family DNA binding protein
MPLFKMRGMNNTTHLLSLPVLAKTMNLPEGWIKAEADAGRLPHLRIGKRYRFNLDAVIRALSERAALTSEGVSYGR